jgi:hypothetical protein
MRLHDLSELKELMQKAPRSKLNGKPRKKLKFGIAAIARSMAVDAAPLETLALMK